MDSTLIIQEFIKAHHLPQSYAKTAEQHFLPLVHSVVDQQASLGRPLFLGIHGCQGSGKSTLTDFILHLLHRQFGLPCVGMSIDDFYLTKQERNQLANDVHPLLQTRGVPGTHDVSLLSSTLQRALTYCGEFSVPSFNKAADDRSAKVEWTAVKQPVAVVILEGWCVGISSQAESELRAPQNQLEREEDPDRIWRTFANDALRENYASIFQQIDRLVMLKAPGFHSVQRWRQEQENRLKLSLSDEQLQTAKFMNEAQIKRFIQHYERLTNHALNVVPAMANDIFELDEHRKIIARQLVGEHNK